MEILYITASGGAEYSDPLLEKFSSIYLYSHNHSHINNNEFNFLKIMFDRLYFLIEKNYALEKILNFKIEKPENLQRKK